MESRLTSKWLVLGIDLITIGISFVLAYIIRFNLSLNFNWSLLEIQLPIVALIALSALLIAGSYKGASGQAVKRDMYTIFKGICIFSVLLIVLILFNRKWEINKYLNIPLSIIFIFNILAFIGLTGTHYIFRLVYSNRT